ncbi:BEM_collapsed_G0011300.mRNA.1.CDS.1 [Saccharomyces cerevisiae]|nr:BEM_HP_G0145690.mRNA.1.CDS.1 [Saccharomyces cerevisiae]CAI6620554.1 BEM_HP_G0145690.mRNA.1.CDS.1 [Saccharomyces cerevisiae]CAI7076715.1 BEM_collapsed_G0011300.mRNA.1.CDS.1 [Saccharomyces cerevisiae]
MRLCIPVYVGDICCLWYRLIDYKISVISSKIPGEKTIKKFFFPNRSILLT